MGAGRRSCRWGHRGQIGLAYPYRRCTLLVAIKNGRKQRLMQSNHVLCFSSPFIRDIFSSYEKSDKECPLSTTSKHQYVSYQALEGGTRPTTQSLTVHNVYRNNKVGSSSGVRTSGASDRRIDWHERMDTCESCKIGRDADLLDLQPRP